MRWHSQWRKKHVRPETGIIRSAFNVQIVLPLRYFRLQIIHVSGDFRFQSIPLGGAVSVADLMSWFTLDRFLGSSLRLRNARNNFIVRFLLRRRYGILGILSATDKIASCSESGFIVRFLV